LEKYPSPFRGLLATKAGKKYPPEAHPIIATIKNALNTETKPKMLMFLQLLVTGVNALRAPAFSQNVAYEMPVTYPGGEPAGMLQAPFIQNEQAGIFGDAKYSNASQAASAVHAAEH